MMRKITLMAALMAATALVTAPAAAQNATTPQPVEQSATARLNQIAHETDRLKAEHDLAAERCDRREMERIKTEASQVASEGRQIITRSRLAGAFSAVDPDLVQRAEHHIDVRMREINERVPRNCPTETAQPPQQIVPAPPVQPTPVQPQSNQVVTSGTRTVSSPVQPTPVQPQPTPAQPLSAQEELRARDRAVVAAQQQLFDHVDQILLNGEDARRAGRCEERADLVAAAWLGINRAQALLREGDVELEALRARAAALRDAPCPPPTPATGPVNSVGGVGLNLGAGITNTEIGGGIGIGTVIRGPDREDRLGQAGAKLIAAQYMASAVASCDLEWECKLEAYYSRGDAQRSASEPSGGNPVGLTFGEDAFGSTGIFLGPTGAAAQSRVRVESLSSSFRAMHRRGSDDELNAAQRSNSTAIGFSIEVGYQKVEQAGTFQSTLFPAAIFADIDQRFDSFSVSVGPVVETMHGIGGGLFIFGGAEAHLGYRTSNLNSHEAITCVPCGSLPDNFSYDVEDESDGVFWYGGMTLGVGLGPSGARSKNDMDVRLEIGWRLADVDTLHVRANPSDGPTRIEPITGFDTFARIGVSLPF